MTERIKSLLHTLKSESYKQHRISREIPLTEETLALPPMQLDVVMLKAMLDTEDPFFIEQDRIGFFRRNTEYPHYLPFYFHGGNNVPNFEAVLHCGMDKVLALIEEKLSVSSSDFLLAAKETVTIVLEFADRYAEHARQAGADELYQSLKRVPHHGATSLLEACVFLKFLIYTLRCNRNTHITLGRFDKYMRPFYEADLKAGKSREELLEIIEEFFISINFDTDLYFGVQKGDNGQSLVLGGCGSFDDFSHLCMEASLELNLIDPKINLRVDKNTPDDLYEFATQLTKQGMGFPQYCNDDVVIPGLIKLGYAPEDAADYAVAACWEFIIPGKGYDVPNITELIFPQVVNQVTQEHLIDSSTFDEFFAHVKSAIAEECSSIPQKCKDQITRTYSHHLRPSPYLSVFIDGCINTGKDLSQGGAIYKNFGCHGVGISTAADSLAAIREVVFQTEEYTKEDLLTALSCNFEGFGALRNRLLSCPKMGNADQSVDTLAYEMMDVFSSSLNGLPNGYGGIFRAGTGSAQLYLYGAQDVGPTADGRLAGAPFGASFSPSLEARLAGPLSCIRSFTGYDLKKVSNGGPLTLELHDTVFRNEDGLKKVAQLVKNFILLGGHQLQLNSINRELLLDALEHPEQHKNLIVRVWGWSGYFNELDPAFQQHIINRCEFRI